MAARGLRMPRFVKSLILVLAVGALAGTFGVTSASASPCSKALIRDWYDGRIDRTYPVHCYREALKDIPEDQDVYGTLRDDLNRALQLAALSGKGPNDSIGGAQGPGAGPTNTKKKDGGIFRWLSNTLGPGNADSIPIPLLVLGGLALLLLAAAGASYAARRIQARKAEPAPAPVTPDRRP